MSIIQSRYTFDGEPKIIVCGNIDDDSNVAYTILDKDLNIEKKFYMNTNMRIREQYVEIDYLDNEMLCFGGVSTNTLPFWISQTIFNKDEYYEYVSFENNTFIIKNENGDVLYQLLSDNDVIMSEYNFRVIKINDDTLICVTDAGIYKLNISEITNIKQIENKPRIISPVISGTYSIDGKMKNAQEKGICIQRFSDNANRKVLVK